MATKEEPYQLIALSDEDAKLVMDAFENFKAAHKVDLSARPIFSEDGRVGCEVRFFKKQALVPKADGFQQEDGNGTDSKETVAA